VCLLATIFSQITAKVIASASVLTGEVDEFDPGDFPTLTAALRTEGFGLILGRAPE